VTEPARLPTVGVAWRPSDGEAVRAVGLMPEVETAAADVPARSRHARLTTTGTPIRRAGVHGCG